jgi:hypothetical protein
MKQKICQNISAIIASTNGSYWLWGLTLLFPSKNINIRQKGNSENIFLTLIVGSSQKPFNATSQEGFLLYDSPPQELYCFPWR